MKNPNDFSLKAVKRSKRKQYLIGIAGLLMVCITLFCIAAVFSPPATNSVPVTQAPSEIPIKIFAPTFPPTWTPKPANSPIPSITEQQPVSTELSSVKIDTSNQASVGFSMPGGSCIPGNTIEVATVTKIVDGDTIHVMMNGNDYSVRYIGIDTPEMTGETYSEQAKAYNSQLVSGQTVMMIKDQNETDQYDRLLRFVIAGSTFVNYDMVEKGYAAAKDYPPDSSCATILASAMDSAKSSNLGLWAAIAAAAAPAIDTNKSSSINSTNCDPSYPDVCIPPKPPDLDCKDITYRNFRVLLPDPHNFDGNKDGIGCEQ